VLSRLKLLSSITSVTYFDLPFFLELLSINCWLITWVTLCMYVYNKLTMFSAVRFVVLHIKEYTYLPTLVYSPISPINRFPLSSLVCAVLYESTPIAYYRFCLGNVGLGGPY